MQLKTTYKEIWGVAWPVILGGISQTIINITDTIFLGRVGETELGASAIAGLFYFVLFMIGLGFASGIQILVARKAGEQKENEISEIVDHGFYIQFILSVLLFVLLKFLSRPILGAIIGDEKLLKAVFEFLDYRSWGIFFIMASLLFRAFYIGIAQTKPVSVSMTLIAIVNIIFNYLLVFGKYGFPEMGIGGSAQASSIAECCGAVFLIIYSLRDPRTRSLRIFAFDRWNNGMILRLVRLSFPIAMQYVISLGGWLVFFFVVQTTGERNLAMSNIVRSVLFVLMTPGWGFFAASNTMTSNVIGQNKSEEVLGLVRKTATMNFAFVLIPVIVISLFPQWVISLFTDNSEIIHAAVPSMYVICIAATMFSFSVIILGAVTGTGSTKVAMIIEITTITLYLCLLFFIAFQLHVKIEILWCTEIFYWIVTGTLSLIYLRSGRWIGRKI